MIFIKRPIPNKDVIEWRKSYLLKMKSIIPQDTTTEEPKGLTEGNKKTGKSGLFFKTIFTWNLPSIATCPCSSEWCRTHCYNADNRQDVFPINDWAENWWWFKKNPNLLTKRIQYQLINAEKPIAIRLHSSGDFFSNSYIKFWRNIAEKNNEILFWAYTRSWYRKDFYNTLFSLKTLPNVQLIASWDKSMRCRPPLGWRTSVVVNTINELQLLENQNNYICSEQLGQIPNCSNCGFCIYGSNKNVVFLLH